MAQASNGERVITGRMVLFGLIAFFGVVFAVNGAMLALALKTNTGVVSSEPYLKGLKYNERLAAEERQQALGWKSEITVDPKAKRIVAVLSDRDGAPLTGMTATAKVGFAVTDREDAHAALTETAPGRYEAAVQVADAGNIIADLEVTDPKDSSQGVVYRARRRLWLAP